MAMLYPSLGGLLSGITGYFYGHKQSEATQQSAGEPQAQHTFYPQTVEHYVRVQKDGDRWSYFSKLHQSTLATYQLINSASIRKRQSTSESNQTVEPESQSSVEGSKTEKAVLKETKVTSVARHDYFSGIFEQYSRQLIQARKCESVELISGPIFTKDTPMQDENKKHIKPIYKSHVKISPQGEYLTDRQFSVVVCNRKNNQRFISGFTYYTKLYPTFRMLDQLTALKKIEEQTGMTLKFEGKQLTQIDYEGISKVRSHESIEETIKSRSD